jgi:hypothetical protein
MPPSAKFSVVRSREHFEAKTPSNEESVNPPMCKRQNSIRSVNGFDLFHRRDCSFHHGDT